MVQARTLFLQRTINMNSGDENLALSTVQAGDIVKRVEELEAHVAESVEASGKQKVIAEDLDSGKLTAKAVVETRRCVQPEVDALNRAVRRYEKRTTISSLQTESRLHELESKLNDVVVLAAAAQRTVEHPPRSYMQVIGNWICAAFVLPAQTAAYTARRLISVIQWAGTCVRSPFVLGSLSNVHKQRQVNQMKKKERRPKTVP